MTVILPYDLHTNFGIFRLVSIEEAEYIQKKRFWMFHLPSPFSVVTGESKLRKIMAYFVYWFTVCGLLDASLRSKRITCMVPWWWLTIQETVKVSKFVCLFY